MARIAVTGASGFIGAGLCRHLERHGHEAVPLSRGGTGPRWHPGVPEVHGVEGCDAVVHLAGERIDQRWTTRARERILASRRDGTRSLATALAALDAPPGVLVSQSAVGWYGDTGDEVVDESAPRGEGFLAEVVEAWEEAATPAREAGIRVVHPRTGVVLGRDGGALKRMLLPFRLGLGGTIAGGRQWFPWIAYRDAMAALTELAVGDGWEGPVNLASPGIVRSKAFTDTLGRVLRRPTVLPLPKAGLRLVFGRMGVETITYGQRVAVARLATGFTWQGPELEAVLADLLGRETAAPRHRNAKPPTL